MSDLIKKIKIKKQDGTFTDYIPIGAEAQNVSTEDGDSVQLKLNKMPYYYNTVIDMKNDGKLKAGDMAITLGYHEANDGGGAEYIIRIKSGSDVEDNGNIHFLQNNLVAKLIIKNDLYPEMFGAYGDNSHDDWESFNNMFKLNKSCKLNAKQYKLSDKIVIPSHCGLYGVPHSRVIDSYRSRKTTLNFSGSNLHDLNLISGDQVSCTDINIVSDAFSTTEDRHSQTLSNPRGWFTTSNNFDNVVGFYNVRCYNCTAIGCTIGFQQSAYGVWENCVIEHCDIGFKFGADSQANLLRGYYCNNLIVANYNNNISNVRGDSVFESLCILTGTGNIISNVVADYVGEYLFEITWGGNSINGVSGDRYGMNHVAYTEEQVNNLIYGQYQPSHYMILFSQIGTGATSITNLVACGGKCTADSNLYGVNGLLKYKGGYGIRNVAPINFGLIPSSFFYKRDLGTQGGYYKDIPQFNINDFRHIITCDNFESGYVYKNKCPVLLDTLFGRVNALKMTLEYNENDLIVQY